MYEHDKVKEMSNKGKLIISTLFDYYYKNQDQIPEQFVVPNNILLSTTDYISGMTDRFAIIKYNQITND